MNLTKKQYRVKCWIPIDDAEDTEYDTYDEAFRVRNELEAMQPENLYEVEEVKPTEDDKHDIINYFVKASLSDELGFDVDNRNQREQKEIIRQMCKFIKFKAFIRDNYYIIHYLGTDKITVVETLFPKSITDENFNTEPEFPKSMLDEDVITNEEPPYPKPRVEKPPGYGKRMEEEIQKNRRELGICPVCGCPDYAVHTFKEMGLVHDLWRACRKCKNCGVVRI